MLLSYSDPQESESSEDDDDEDEIDATSTTKLFIEEPEHKTIIDIRVSPPKSDNESLDELDSKLLLPVPKPSSVSGTSEGDSESDSNLLDVNFKSGSIESKGSIASEFKSPGFYIGEYRGESFQD